jgi:outer membrane protein
LTTALQRNLGLLVERYERAQFRLRIDENLGIYDLSLVSQAFTSENTSPSTGELTGADILVTEQQNLFINPDQLTPWGGIAGFELNVFRNEDNSEFSNPNPRYQSDADLTLTQPLLRNFGRLATERGIRIAQLNSGISREVFEQEVASTLQQVENTYWNLVEARQQVEVARESLSLARELHQMNRVRVDVGTLAPLELVQSEVGIATREEQIILAVASVENAEDQLRRLLHLEQGELWERPIEPTTPPETERTAVDLASAIATARSERPELRNQQLRVDLLDLESRFARNQALPRLDLEARYGYNGIGGDVRDERGVVVAPGGLSDAFEQVTRRDFDGWRVQLTFAYPLQNRTARARKAIADLDLEQGRNELSDLEELIQVEVRSAVRGVRTAAQQIASTRASRGLAEQNLEAERKRYENGLSTSFQVLEIQEDLTAARSREVSAVAGYRRALAEYWRATGRLLEEEGVEFTDPLHVEDEDLRRFGWGIADVQD